MCHQCQPLPENVVQEIARAIESGAMQSLDFAVDKLQVDSLDVSATENNNLFTAYPSLFPGDATTVITQMTGGTCETAELTWGFAVGWTKQLVYNTRIETAQDPTSFWADALRNRRGVLPVRAFFETHRTETIRSNKTGKRVKRRYRFASDAGEVLFLACIYGSGCFSVVTTEPNDTVGAVHDRMPLLLSAQGVTKWLSADYLQCASDASVSLVAFPEDAGAVQLSLF